MQEIKASLVRKIAERLMPQSVLRGNYERGAYDRKMERIKEVVIENTTGNGLK